MKREAYDTFMQILSKEFADIENINDMIEDANELAKYGEKRIALENLLENLIESNISISEELIDFAREAFSDRPSDYDDSLINTIMENK